MELQFHVPRYKIALLILALITTCGMFMIYGQDEPITCPNAPVSRLVVGEQGVVTPAGANNVRSSPQASANLVGQIPSNGLFLVLEGPTCADGLAWWRVEYGDIEGWTAEGQIGDYWLEPAGALPTQAATVTNFPTATSEFPLGAACPGFLPSRLVVGEQGKVTSGSANNVRVDPNSSSENIGQIRANRTFLVLAGPECADGLAWWRVNYQGMEGWTAEGADDEYWLEPAGPVPTKAPTLTPTITNTPRPTVTPRPTGTSVPSVPPIQIIDDIEPLINAPLPDNLQTITTDNASALELLSIVGYGDVRTMEIAPNGTTIALVTDVGVWLSELTEASRGSWQLLDHPQFLITAIEFSADGQLLAIGGESYRDIAVPTLKIWDLSTESLYPQAPTFHNDIVAMEFSSDGKWLAVAESNRSVSTVSLVDLQTEQVRDITPESVLTARQLTFNHDNTLLAISDNFENVNLYNLDLQSHQISYQIQGTLGAVRFSPDGQYLFASGNTGGRTLNPLLRIWDLATSTRLESIELDGRTRRSVQFSPDSKRMILASTQNFTILNLENLTVENEWQFQGYTYRSLFTPDNRYIALHEDGTIRDWRLHDGSNEVLQFYPITLPSDWKKVTADEQPLVIAEEIMESQARREIGSSLTHGFHPIEEVNITADNLAVVKHEESLIVWNMETRQPLAHILHFGRSIGFSEDGTIFMTQVGDTQWLWGISE